MPRIDNDRFFKEQIEKFGLEARGVNWGSEESQRERFRVIAELIPDISESTVLDLGCGFGDLYLFLKEKNLIPRHYVGVDSVLEMVKVASERVPEVKRIDFIADGVPSADYIVASGSFNILTYRETREVIAKAYRASQKAFIFNIMSTHADYFEPGYNYFSPSEMVAYCMSFTRKMILRADYMPHDFTIKMFKGDF